MKAKWDDGTIIFRTARKAHHCDGSHDHAKGRRATCLQGGTISKGEPYVEYLGESPLYQNGYRYHYDCAETQGLLIREGDA